MASATQKPTAPRASSLARPTEPSGDGQDLAAGGAHELLRGQGDHGVRRARRDPNDVESQERAGERARAPPKMTPRSGRSRARSVLTGLGWPSGGTPPMAKPVVRRT